MTEPQSYKLTMKYRGLPLIDMVFEARDCQELIDNTVEFGNAFEIEMTRVTPNDMPVEVLYDVGGEG